MPDFNLALASPEASDRLAAVRELKNSLIGSRTRKTLFIQSGALAKLAELTRDHANHPEISVQAAMTIGSLAFGTEEHVAASCNKDVISSLVLGCSSTNHAVVLACVKTLRTMYKSPVPAVSLLTDSGDGMLFTLLKLLGESETATEAAASLLARFCSQEAHIASLVTAGAAKRLADTLQHCRHEGSQLAILNALIALTSESNDACQYIATTGPAINHLLLMLRGGGSGQLGLRVTACIANIFRWKATCPPPPFSPPSSSAASRSSSGNALFAVRRHVITTVLPLMKEPATRVEAADVFVKLVQDDIEVQELLCTLDMPRYIALYFGENDVAADSPLLRERGLRVMAAYTSNCNRARFQVKASPTLMREIKQGLNVANPDSAPVRQAACSCVLSLSRSVKVMRKELVEANILKSVAMLLEDPFESVKEAATAALCNMLLEFSPLKKDGIDFGVIEIFAKHILGGGGGGGGVGGGGGGGGAVGGAGGSDGQQRSSDALQINSAWALKNLLYSVHEETVPSPSTGGSSASAAAEAAGVKGRVISALTWSSLSVLLTKSNSIQEHAAGILQNLVFGGGGVSDVTKAAAGFGGTDELVNILGRLLESTNTNVVVHALYTANNIAAEGENEHKDGLVNNKAVMARIVQKLISPITKVQVPAIWCIRNLTRATVPGADERQASLLSSNPNLRQYLQDVAMLEKYDVKAHARSALNEFNKGVGPL